MKKYEAKIRELRNGLCLFSESGTKKCLILNRKCFIEQEPQNCIVIKNEPLAEKILSHNLIV